MSANLHIGKWGGSLAVRIPKAIAEQCGVSEGSSMAMDVQDVRLEARTRAIRCVPYRGHTLQLPLLVALSLADVLLRMSVVRRNSSQHLS